MNLEGLRQWLAKSRPLDPKPSLARTQPPKSTSVRARYKILAAAPSLSGVSDSAVRNAAQDEQPSGSFDFLDGRSVGGNRGRRKPGHSPFFQGSKARKLPGRVFSCARAIGRSDDGGARDYAGAGGCVFLRLGMSCRGAIVVALPGGQECPPHTLRRGITAITNCGNSVGQVHASKKIVVSRVISNAVHHRVRYQPAHLPAFLVNRCFGLWHTNYTADNAPFAETFKEWHSDGTEFENVNQNPAVGSVCVGVWKMVGARKVRLHHLGFLFNADGTSAGTFIVDETDTVGTPGSSYVGAFTFSTYDVNGNLTGQVKGTVAATRITVD